MLRLGAAQARGLALRPDAGAEERFRDIDIAKPRHHLLIEQRRLDRRPLARERAGQNRAAEIIAERLGPKTGQQRMAARRLACHQIHQAEAAGIVEHHPRVVFHREDDVIVAHGRLGRASWRLHAEAPRHAKMRQQHQPALKLDEQVFRPPSHRQDPPAGKLAGKAAGQRAAQILAAHVHRLDPAAFEGAGKAAADDFDFGKFGHGRGRVARLDALRYGPAMVADPLQEETDFGFQRVSAGEKARLVRGIFDRVAPRYDLMNDLMSGGIHRWWKRVLIERLVPRARINSLAPQARMHLLDVAGGTGDIAFRFLERCGGSGGGESGGGGSGARVTVCDINAAMLAVGRDRALDRGLVEGIDWICGDAEALPLPDGSIDAYTIAFGIRNVTRIDRALAEARRVLKPGGRFLCLEFSKVVLPGLDRLYDTYSFALLPRLGALVAGDGDSYRYLVESIRRFPDQERFRAMIEDAGLGHVRVRNLSGGIAALHSAWRL